MRIEHMQRLIVQPEWLYRDLLVGLGTSGDVRALLEAKGYQPPPEDTVQGWKNRNSIPGKWVPVLVELGIEKGIFKDVGGLKPRGRKRVNRSSGD
jgi:hypothetical protein